MTTTIPICSFEEDVSMNREFAVETYYCSDPATWLAWLPPSGVGYDPHGIVSALCGDHLTVITAESPDAEVAAITDLPMRCAACGEPVWAKHPEPHSTGQRCDLCQTSDAEHPACSCPNEAAYLAAMTGSES